MDSNANSTRAIARLCFALVMLAIIWGVVLPQLSDYQPIAQHIQSMQAHEVEVDALFYTDLGWIPGDAR